MKCENELILRRRNKTAPNEIRLSSLWDKSKHKVNREIKA